MNKMINITLPDGSIQEYDTEVTGYEIADNIGPRLLADSIAIEIQDKLYDLSHLINQDSIVRIITKNDPNALDILRHSTAHLLAQAVTNLYPTSQFGTGPSTDDGFYYDFLFDSPISDEDLAQIENEMYKISKTNQDFSRDTIDVNMAKKIFNKQQYKLELIESVDTDEGIESDNVTTYSNDKFTDLCLGPHVPNTSYLKHFKLLRVGGAYWRGVETNDQLQRIYGTSWFTKKDLDTYLTQREEAYKRDHRKLGKQLNLFISSDQLGPGQFIWNSRGAILREIIEKYSKTQHTNYGYDLVSTPHIGKSTLWETSGHLDFYKDAMYPSMEVEDGSEYYLKPMNCPFHILSYQSDIRSYRDLPMRLFELGSVYRYEKTGVLHGLLRARGFTQDDAHIFCTIEQLDAELENLLNFSISMLSVFGFNEIEADLSTKPTKAIGDSKIWESSTESLKKSLITKDIPYKIASGEGAFYGPKIDLHVKDAIGRRWQLSTIQVDFAQPDNFDLNYVNKDNKKLQPVMIHRALLGSIERFTGILLEHYNGNLPGWLAPDQIVVITLSENAYANSEDIRKKLSKFRTVYDNSNTRLSERIKKYKLMKIPVIIIIGDNDISNKTLAINFSDGRNEQDIKINAGLSSINKYLKEPLLKIK